jgi:hypothetical protein
MTLDDAKLHLLEILARRHPTQRPMTADIVVALTDMMSATTGAAFATAATAALIASADAVVRGICTFETDDGTTVSLPMTQAECDDQPMPHSFMPSESVIWPEPLSKK